MIYSKTCEYAVRALAFLAEKPVSEKTRVPEICAETGAPAPYLSKIFQCLVTAGILASHRGARGGFSFTRDPKRVSVMEIIEAVDSLEPWSECMMGLSRCDDKTACPIHDIWKQAKTKMTKKFRQTKLTDMLAKIAAKHYREVQRTRLNIMR